jgi:D-galactonate transporter
MSTDTSYSELNSSGIVDDRVYRKIALRIIPIVMICYFCAYLDRINVGFAKLQMMNDLKLSDAAYGLGAGLFFLGYFLFEVPSNLLMARIGAKRTLIRIMLLWGLISGAFAFITLPWQFYVMRVLLGAAEAGFFPGIILFLTYWFPSHHRARMTGYFYTAVPLSGLIGAPVSGWIMTVFHGSHGLDGWQWLFVLEAIPTIVMAMLLPFILVDRPRAAKWLSPVEIQYVEQALDGEEQRKRVIVKGESRLAHVLASGCAWHLITLAICQTMGLYAISFWLPTLVKEIGFTSLEQIGWYSAIPFAIGAVALNLVCRSSDKYRERRWHSVFAFVMTAIGLVMSTLTGHNPVASLIALSIAAAGVYAATTMFWTLPSQFFFGIGAAVAIGMINSFGNLGGFLSPYAIGLIKDATGANEYGVYLIAAVSVLGSVLVLLLPKSVVNH